MQVRVFDSFCGAVVFSCRDCPSVCLSGYLRCNYTTSKMTFFHVGS